MVLGVGVILIVVIVIYLWPKKWLDPKGREKEMAVLNLEKYDFDSLRKRGGIASGINIGGTIAGVELRRKEKYEFQTRQISFDSDGKKISGMMNYYPERSSLSKLIIMIRGYAETEGYYSGSGTWRVADQLAKAGYTTISLDFLGYGKSERESSDVLEARFHKVVEVMDLIESVKALPWVDKNKIGIWAHSNGGQIALSVLETTGQNYPTVLWAPMTQTFPESVLSTIETDSPIKEIIKEFEKHYDTRRYAFENYYEWIKAPVLIQQGTGDEWCQVGWQQRVVGELKNLKKEAELVIYEGDDHNLSKNWDEAVEKDIGWWKF